MPKNCFVPGCDTVFKKRSDRKPGEKNLTFFSAPKDPMLRKQWHIASRRGDREMTVRDVICELHFTEDCLLRYFTTDLFDGTVFKLERSRPGLKKGSVPSIFPFKSNSDLKGRKRKKFRTVDDEQEKNRSSDFDFERNSLSSKQNQVLVCSAYECTNSSDKKIPGISFHRFPTDKLQKTWMRAVRQDDWMPSRESILCSAHFTPDQIKQTGSSAKLKLCAIPTIFSSGKKNQKSRQHANLQAEEYDSSNSNTKFSYSTEIREYSNQDSDEEELPVIELDSSIQEESVETPEKMSSSDEDMPSTSENFIVEGHENIFGKFVANELKILSCDPPLYLRTMQKIWQVLEDASKRVK